MLNLLKTFVHALACKYSRSVVVNTSLVVVAFLNAGCLFSTHQKPSYILIAVDRLGANSLSCPEYLDKGEGAFYVLCSDFVRFTNAYTTSMQSSATIASVMTGKYPIEHGVRHSDHYLSSKHVTIAHELFKNGYETGFFSGGDPIPSYIGLNKGFQSFFDFGTLNEENTLTMDSLFDGFIKWWDKRTKPKFSFLYLPMLRYPKAESQGYVDLERNLNKIFQLLQKNKRWHNTHVVFFGLQGSLKYENQKVWPPIDLSENNIKVELFFKPAGKIRDKEISFQVDQNISLADLGQTLFELAKLPTIQSNTEFFNVSPFTNVLLRKSAPKAKRTLLVESGWPDWRYGYAPVYLVVQDQYRVELDKQLNIYNTLLGRDIKGVPDGQIPEDRWLSFIKMSAYVNSDGKSQFQDIELEKLNLGAKLWGDQNYDYKDALDDIKELSRRLEPNDELWGWQAQLATKHEDCKLLLDISKKHRNFKWEITAKSCLGTKIGLSNRTQYQCQKIYQPNLKSWPKACQNDLLYYTWRFLNEKVENKNLKDELKLLLRQRNLRQYLQVRNWQSFLSSARIYETSIRPDDFDLYTLQLKKDSKKKLQELQTEIAAEGVLKTTEVVE